MKNRCASRFRHMLRCDSGVAFVEFALCLPFLLLLFFGTVEISRYILAVQKVEKTVDMITDIIGQADGSSPQKALSPTMLASLFNLAPSMMRPYDFNTNGVVIITHISRPDDASQPPEINWQACGGGTLAHGSQFGPASGTETPQPANLPLPNGFTLQPGEEVLIGEIYYNFSPLTPNVMSNISMSRFAIYVPRSQSLSNYTSQCS